MTLKESILQEIETADDKLLEDLLQLIRSRTTKKSILTLSDTIEDLLLIAEIGAGDEFKNRIRYIPL
ncbi:MAG: hypothetical protein LH631_06040 [Alkalinema sp. CAN_BIN05]|nr:hypothetical protein [Alkalinema sp. CAN_BIN05]